MKLAQLALGLLLFSCLFSRLAFGCQNRVFDLKTADLSLQIQDVLYEFAKECHFSIAYDDEQINTRLQKKLPLLDIEQKSLSYIFDLLFDIANVHYRFDDDILHLDLYANKTFMLNYVNTERIGTSNTSIFINKDNGQSTNASQSKSGIDISAQDGFNFWDTIQEEIQTLLNLSQDSQAKPQETPQVIINKGAGLIHVRGDQKQLKSVQKYLDLLHERLQQQVLIDVHILSVSHKDANTKGINWEDLYGLQNFVLNPQLTNNTSALSGINIQGKKGIIQYGFNIFSQGISLNNIIQFLETYGQVHSISNPKVLTLNNQPALISVGEILHYKKTSTFQNTNAQTTITNTDDEYPSLFAGILLDITPFVFHDGIILKINPSITKIKENIINLKNNALLSPPNLITNQLSSIVKIKDQQKIILGGLISTNQSQEKNKIPLLGDLPLLKTFFSYSQQITNTEEMIFIIEARLINNSPPSIESLGYHYLQ